MRNFCFFVFLYASQVLANADVPPATLEQQLLSLAKTHNLAIAYDATLLEGMRAASAPAEQNLDLQLTALLAPHNLTFTRSAQGIVINRRVPAPDKPESQQHADPQDSMENLTVVSKRLSGIYAARNRNLMHSQDATKLKRELIEFSDSLSRMDIDAFPQQNLVEGLQVIPGIAIERDKGIGQRVNLRSLPNQFTYVSINNLATASGTGDREVDLSMFASEVVQTVTIKKSTTAADPESGIAGNVQITTGRPFDYLTPTFLVNLEMAHNSLADNSDPKVSLLATKTWDKWGALFSFAHSQRTNRTDATSGVEFRPLTRWLQKTGSQSNQAQSDQAAGVLLRDTGIEVPDRFDNQVTDRIVFINKVADSVSLNTQTRWGAIGSLQYKPNEQFLLTFDAMLGAYQANEDEYQIAAYSGSSRSTLDTIHHADTSTFASEGIVVLSDVSFTQTQHEILSLAQQSDTDYAHFNLTADWLWDNWNLVAGAGYSSASRFEDNANLKHVYYGPSRSRFTAIAGETLPSDAPDSKNMYYSADDFRFESYAILQQAIEDRNYVASMDAAYTPTLTADSGALTLQFGSRYSRSNTERNAGDVIMGWPDTTAPRSLAENPLYAVHDLVPGGSFSLNAEDWLQMSNAQARKLFRPQGLKLPYNVADFYAVNEEVVSTYAMANWASEIAAMPLRVNAGVRHYATTTRSSGSEITHTAYRETLPSLNASLEFYNNLLLRLSAAKTFTRPSLEDIAYRRTESASDYKYRDGNPNLHPMFARQWEMALEYYLPANSLLAASYFNKRICGLIREQLTGIEYDVKKYNANGTLDGYYDYDVYQKVNIDDAYTISGTELIAKLALGHWWPELEGVQVNATYTLLDNSLKAESDLNIAAPPVGLAKNNLDMSLIYSTALFDILLSYNYRSHYVEAMGYDMYPVYRDSYGQLDIATTLHLSDTLRLSFKGINMTNSAESSYNISPLFPNKYQTAGRRIGISLAVEW